MLLRYAVLVTLNVCSAFLLSFSGSAVFSQTVPAASPRQPSSRNPPQPPWQCHRQLQQAETTVFDNSEQTEPRNGGYNRSRYESGKESPSETASATFRLWLIIIFFLHCFLRFFGCFFRLFFGSFLRYSLIIGVSLSSVFFFSSSLSVSLSSSPSV